LTALHLAVMISTPKHDLDKKIWPESVTSTWMVGAVPVTCKANDPELVMEVSEKTESTSSDVFWQLATELALGCFPT